MNSAQVYNTTKNFLTERTIKQGSLHDWRCTVSAMVLYFFLTAGAIWWLLLTVTWFLSTGLAWGQVSKKKLALLTLARELR